MITVDRTVRPRLTQEITDVRCVLDGLIVILTVHKPNQRFVIHLQLLDQLSQVHVLSLKDLAVASLLI